MTELYKLLFDLALYYTLTGCFLPLIFSAGPSAIGFFSLVAAIGADALLRRSKTYSPMRSVLPLLLPCVIFFIRPGFWAIMQILPPWAYLGWCFFKGKVETEYTDFTDRFSFGTKMLFLLVFGTLALDRFKDAFLTALPYLVLMLADGVCLLRMLRERKSEGVRQAIYMVIFLAASAAVTIGKAPQLLLKSIGLAYRYVVSPILICVCLGIAFCIYGVYLLLRWLASLKKEAVETPTMQLESVAEMLGIEEEYKTYAYNFTWLKILLIAIGICLVILFLFLLFRRLLGDGGGEKEDSPFREEREKFLGPAGKSGPGGLIRPRNPRLAVRYYYKKYLLESRKRGREVPRSMTVEELISHCAPVFPGESPEKLTEIYSPARYSQRIPVTEEDAALAAECWNSLKRAKPPKIK